MSTFSESAALEKEQKLQDILRSYGDVVVAFSGGVDSTYLADVAREVLGDKALLVLADSASVPRSELARACALTQERGWPLDIVQAKEFENEAFLVNDEMRCFHCKADFFTQLRQYADDHDIHTLAYGETADDIADATRMGRRAAQQCEVTAPLLDAGLVKEEIRFLSKRRNLPTWNKASFACLASRIPVGTRISPDDLAKVERAEDLLKSLGFNQYRARHHGDICRIEVEQDDFGKLLDPQLREQVVSQIRNLGYRFVALDLAGYRTGSTAGRT